MSSTSNGHNPQKSTSKRTGGSGPGATNGGEGPELYKKYAKASSSNWLDPSSKLKPSDLCKSSVDVVADDYPMIIEFNNIKDNSCQVHSTVDIDQPLFQPSPKVVVFEDYAPFAIHEKKLFFRNNDSVARRIKVHRPKTPFFEISAPKTPNGEPLKQTKIAAGMEIYYIIRFKPQQVHEYSLELICSTEREKFVVPIRAVGMQPRMTFPDEIIFGTCAVKSTTRKTLLVQNVGSSVARFFMRTSLNPQSFTSPSEELTVEAGASQMIELFFTPQSAKPIEGEIEVEFVNNKLRCYIAVTGMGRNVDVSLSTPSVALEPSYISLSSQKTMRIKNTSDVPINFVWKSFSSQEEEEAERSRLLNEINRMEAIEQNAFRDRLQSGFYDHPASYNQSEYDPYAATSNNDGFVRDDDNGSFYSPQARADAAILMRKYRNLRTALENDPMQFVDDIFEISPVSGNVWARSEIEITITFRPDTAAKYTCLGYLDISGRQDRLSLHLSGQGIGPHAALSFDVLDVGDVFINDEQYYDLSISNKGECCWLLRMLISAVHVYVCCYIVGDIPAQWSFLPSLTRFGNKFDFSPKSGYLAAGHSQSLKIRFECDVLGEFSEVFRFALQGNDDVLACQVKGHVVGPTFHFDCGRIDFGVVSFDYLHSTKLRLVNTSKISMVYNLHVPQDGTFLKREFDVEPKEGTLGPGQYVSVSIEFIPSSVKVYDYSLAVDVLGVGESLLSVPISAECKVMSLKLIERDIMYGDVFIRYPYERELLLFNPSDVLHTKFEMMPQLTYTKYFATYEAEPSVGVIEPGDTMRVTMRLVADKLANFKMPVMVSIAGSKEPPLTATLQYACVGPRVKADATEIRWGNIDCLRDSSRSLCITNDSMISAHVKIFLKMARSKFELSASEMVLEPNQSYELVITANLDDSVVIKDEVHIVVDEGDDIMVPLSAKGVGTTMFCGHDLNTLDLGVQLTNCVFEKKIVLENKGRRVQQLRWINVTNKEENQSRATKVKGTGKDPNISRLPKHLAPIDPVFTVTPEEITLRPRTATTFTFKGFSPSANSLKEIFMLESKVGKDRTFKQIAMTEVKCSVVNPLLEFSEPRLDYIYTWQNDVPALVQRRNLVLKNSSAISLTFVMSVENPFNLSSFEHTLQPSDSCEVVVEFDPLYRDDKQSHNVEKVLMVTYRGHPQKDSIPLTAEIIFPNLSFDASAVAFGCVLNDSSKLIKLIASNVSKVVCTYEWMFQDEINKTAKRVIKDKRASTKKEAHQSTQLSCDQVFDVMPVRSVLFPGESEEIQFTMFGIGNAKVNGTAVCLVEGGPEYCVPLSGEASTVAFTLDKSVIDFGSVVFTDRKDEEIGIINNGKVLFEYEIFPLTTKLGEILEAIPSFGRVNPGDRAKITLRIRLATPTAVSDTLMFKVAHFDPVPVNIYCNGIFPSAVVSLPRHARIGPYGETAGPLAELWDTFTTQANDNITQLQQSLAPPPSEALPAPFSATSASAPMFVPPMIPIRDDDTSELENELRQFLLDNSPVKSLTSATKGPQQLNLEVEMQRLALCYHLNNRIEETKLKLTEEFEQKQVQADLDAAVQLGNSLSGTTIGSAGTARSNTGNSITNAKSKGRKGGTGGGHNVVKEKEAEKEDHGLQALVAKYIDLKDIITANYICDFGNVIIGQQRKKVFQVCNASQAGHISWVFEKKFLSGSPFSIEPDRVSKLLEMGSIDFIVKCNARNDSKLGRKTYVLPIEIKGTGTANILLSGNFCLPEIDLSAEEVDFGRVLIGRSKQMFVRMFNTSPVTAQWKIKVAGNERDNRVTVTPSEGSLRAGKHTMLCLEFIPQEARAFSLEKVFKIESNKKTKSLRITGEGVGMGIKFEPAMCEMNPVVPFSDGDSKYLTMINTSDIPVEVYSLDFDMLYREEEQLLQSLPVLFDESGILRCDPRGAGDGLPREAVVAKARSELVLHEGHDGVAVTGDGADGLLPAPMRTHPAPRDDNKHQDILLVGAPVSGMTVLSDNLSRKLQLPVKLIDALIEDVAGTTGDVGLFARRCTGRMTTLEAAEVEEKINSLNAAAEQSKIEAEAAYQKSKNKKKGKDLPDEVLQTPEVAEYQRYLDSGKLSAATLAEILRARLAWDDVGYGMIIDNVYSKYASERIVLESLKEALPGLIVGNVIVNDGENGFLSKVSSLYYLKSNRVNEMAASIENCRKSIMKIKLQIEAAKVKEAKQTKMSSVPGTTAQQAAYGDTDNEAAIPQGDEPWIKQETGLVTELDPLDYKALDLKQKLLYNRQLLHQLLGQLVEDEVVLAKIRRIWDAENGLKTVVDAAIEPSRTPVDVEVKAAAELVVADGAPVSMEDIERGSVQTVNNTDVPDVGAAGIMGRLSERTIFYSDYVCLLALVEDIFVAKRQAEPETSVTMPTAGTTTREKTPSRPVSRPVSGSKVADVPNPEPSGLESLGSAPSETIEVDQGVDRGANNSVNDHGLFLIPVEAEDNEDAVQNIVMALLPPPRVPPPDKNAVPSPKLMQVIRKPHSRIERKIHKQYSIIPLDASEIVALNRNVPVEGVDQPLTEETPNSTLPLARGQYRWIIPAFGSTKFKVHFQSQSTGKFEMNLRFEVLGSQQQFNLHCAGICELPNINRDTRNLFMRRQKQAVVGMPLPQRKFLSAEDTYCFGPLLLFKKPEWRSINQDTATETELLNYSLVSQTNVDVIRLSNNGKFKCSVECGFQNTSDDVRGIFLVEPHTVDLEEGETKEVKIWAFPNAVREYANNLIICVSNNPVPLSFGVKCWGVEPTIELDGPWKDAVVAAEAALVACVDKKLIKDLQTKLQQLKDDMTLDFERQLIDKVETRSYQVANSSLLPVAFAVDLGDFKDSVNMSIFPLEGVIPANTTIPITLSFTAPNPLMLTGKFSMRYSDAEGGLLSKERVGTKGFRAVAEAYKITAVSMTFEGKEEGGSEMDFGLLRVGDYATQVMKIANKGKYKIGYKFQVPKGTMSNLFKIEPEEGIIESGSNVFAEVKVTFCCAAGELSLRSNKDIRVVISEPLTGELVESFPFYVSASVKYNAFRMQPAKGLAFGAIRFDSESKSKRVELRNEGNFEFLYVICPARAEVEELDTLDNPAFSCYAFNVPPALRKGELGENYLERLGSGVGSTDLGKGSKGKDAKPPPKGGKAPAAGAGVGEGGKGSNNTLAFDPDALSLGPVPTDALTIGSFRINPRIGVVQPGQSVGIDATFDPSGCGTVHEKLRICITGINPKDPGSVVLKSFELTGESCVPAILVDDVVGIFEEQEVVSSLAESIGNGDSSIAGGVKVDKIGVGKVVYAEADKVLAFGPVLCGAAGSRGVVERVKITNPTKIDTRVAFTVSDGPAAEQPATDSKAEPKNKGKDAKQSKGGKDAQASVDAPVPSAAFTVQPSVWEIPPHESRFVNIYFNPAEIKNYRASFCAVVDTAGSTTSAPVKYVGGSGKQLTFDIVGSGTIPCISVELPKTRLSDGSLSLDFNRVHINRTCMRKIILSNDGVMPVTCLFDMAGDDDFQFSYRGASLTLQPHEKGECVAVFMPKKVFVENNAERAATIKVSVLNNQFDSYIFRLKGTAYACEAVLDTAGAEQSSENAGVDNNDGGTSLEDAVTLPEVNLAEGSATSCRTIKLRSRSEGPLKFCFNAVNEEAAKVISFVPKVGHIGPGLVKEIKVLFAPVAPLSLTSTPLTCSLTQIIYGSTDDQDVTVEEDELTMRGSWDDGMKSARIATENDLKCIAATDAALKAYNESVEAEKKKGKKGKPVPVPDNISSNLQLGPMNEDGSQIIFEIVDEPTHTVVTSATVQELQMTCSATADTARYSCAGNGENIPFRPTFMYQAAVHRFSFTNESNIAIPVNWYFDNIKRQGTTNATRTGTTRNASRSNNTSSLNPSNPVVPCPFAIEPEAFTVLPKQTKEFLLRFQPIEVDDFVYLLRGETIPASSAVTADSTQTLAGPIRMVVRGTAKRPICHIDMKESVDYLTRRPANLPNEYGMKSPIETGDIRVAELESTGLKTRNTYRFHVSNPTTDNYEFCWESVGENSPAWRCVQSAGMLFSGKRVEMVFEYLPEETAPAEAFFKFKLPSVGLEQLFLFAGKVIEPKVFLSTSKIDFHSVMLSGEGSSEVVYLENTTHLPFNFAFEKGTLLQLEGPKGPVLDINPKSGVVLPQGKIPISLAFKPQEEVAYNFNIQLDVKRKPNKLSINVKGEGYAVHPLIQLEQGERTGSNVGDRYLTLRPAPSVNYADFGAVQVLDSISKKLSVLNSGKYNFDYVWNTESAGNMLTLSGGKMGGTLHKGQEMSYTLSFAPTREVSLDGSMLSFTVAGKYVYNIFGRGTGVTPALRFSFMHYDFGACFVTSPGGSTVVEEVVLRLVNHDPSSNIAIECIFTKTRALWVECPPTVLEAGMVLDIPIRFAPRDVKDYEFIVPFVVNGTSKVNVNIIGKGITARVELASAANRRTNFGIVNVGSEVRKPIQLVNRSKRAVTVQLLEEGSCGSGGLETRCVRFYPTNEFTIGPKEASTVQLVFSPNKRISNFNEDLLIRFAGLTRKLLTVAGKAQGMEVSLDTDSLPFGTVVMDSQKVRKVTLENAGDLPITYQWMESTFGPHFSISPLSGKVNPADEVSFQVVFRPRFVDEDIRQENILLSVPGVAPMMLTCSGSCINQPSESISTLTFKSLARKAEVKAIKISNPSDKDWYISPSLQGIHWTIPHEFKIPAKGAADLSVTYFPLSMAVEPNSTPQQSGRPTSATGQVPASSKRPASGSKLPGGQELGPAPDAAVTTVDSVHEGQLFLALPDGTAQLYKLRGYAGLPECTGSMNVASAAKKPCTTTVRLLNWLGDTQKFKVSHEFTEKASPATFVVAANAVEVGPNGTKEFPVRYGTTALVDDGISSYFFLIGSYPMVRVSAAEC
jgi:hypothetical protein